ncbi:lamin tail domain-containing protein [Haloarchaeobius amylolyticus]|uniref:lamin tail domain-containing protein n=1 Tax=Haloarchaeobius amylolyticus TaxID=1198296 RepID=UPI00226F2D03|nr:lamin tail domain-containing protein [Haloarchaeobius amylolyticus]
MRKTRSWGTVLVVCLVVLAGCAGGPGTTDGTTTGPGEVPETDGTATQTQATANGTLSVHYINVGQSTSILLVGPSNETMLIDTGDWRNHGEYVINYLEAKGITRIDHLVTSHADADHIGGHAAVIETFETKYDGVGAIYDPGIASSSNTYGRYLDAVEKYDVPLYRAGAGDRIPFEGVDVSVIAPPEGYIANEARNENSLSLRVQHGGVSFLFTGDGEEALEEYLLANQRDQLDVTVLKTGHHGSRSSNSAALLDAASPRVAIISSAYDSQYGHPHEEVLQRLADRSVPTYWTATHGSIEIVTDGQTLSIATQQQAPTVATSVRDGSATAPETTGSLTVRDTIAADGSSGQSSGATRTPEQYTATPVATDGGITVDNVHADAEGTESENLNDEYVVFSNDGDAAVDMSGWTVTDAAGNSYTVPDGFTLEAGASVTLHTGSGEDTDTDLYWGSGSPIWNNDGDTVIVQTDNGETVLEEAY